MTRFLALCSAVLFSTLSVALFGASSANAQTADQFPFYTSQGVYRQVPGSQVEDHTTDWQAFFWDNFKKRNTSDYTTLKASFDKAIQDGGAWGVVQRDGISDSKQPYKMYYIFWTEKANCDFHIIRSDNPTYTFYYLNSRKTSDPGCRVYTVAMDTFAYSSGSSYSQLISSRSSSSRGDTYQRLFLFTGDYTVQDGIDKEKLGIVGSHTPKKVIKLPLFISQIKASSGKSDAGDVIGQIDPDAYKKVNGTDVLPDLYDLKLFKQVDSVMEPLPSEMPHLGPGINRWRDIPYGKYRFMAHAFFNPEVSGQYHVLTSTVDIIVDEKGFTLIYDTAKQKSCFFRKGASDVGLWDLNRRDPNNNSWSSPGSAPERCLDRNLWDTDNLSETIQPEYDFDKLQPCNAFDLACHISRFFNSITGWFMDAISFLFIPDGSTVQNLFSGFTKRFNDSLGFLSLPFTFLGNVFNTVKAISHESSNCTLPALSIFGAQAQLHLCAWRHQLPAVWSFMQLIIQGGIAIGFLWSVYRVVMRIFGVPVDDHDDEDDIEYEEVRWRDDRTGETGDWTRRHR